MKFKLKYIHQQQSVFNALICNSNNKYVAYSKEIMTVLNKLNAKYVFNLMNVSAINSSVVNDLNGIIGLMHELIQILQINNSGNVGQIISDLKQRLYSILNVWIAIASKKWYHCLWLTETLIYLSCLCGTTKLVWNILRWHIRKLQFLD